MFTRSYALLSWSEAARFPLALAAMTAVMIGLIGSFDPSVTITCERSDQARSEGVRAHCVFVEQTLLGERSRGELPFPGTTLELVAARKPSDRTLRIITPSGVIQVSSQISGSRAVRLEEGVEAFVAATSPTLERREFHEGFSVTALWFMFPLAMLISSGPLLGLGGSLEVEAGPRALVVRRRRWLIGSTGQATLSFVFPQRPRVFVRRLGGRYRWQGVLVGEAGGESTVLGASAGYDVLARIANDVNAHYEATGDAREPESPR